MWKTTLNSTGMFLLETGFVGHSVSIFLLGRKQKTFNIKLAVDMKLWTFELVEHKKLTAAKLRMDLSLMEESWLFKITKKINK